MLAELSEGEQAELQDYQYKEREPPSRKDSSEWETRQRLADTTDPSTSEADTPQLATPVDPQVQNLQQQLDQVEALRGDQRKPESVLPTIRGTSKPGCNKPTVPAMYSETRVGKCVLLATLRPPPSVHRRTSQRADVQRCRPFTYLVLFTSAGYGPLSSDRSN